MAHWNEQERHWGAVLGMHLLMSSNLDVITAALRMLQVVDSTETPSAEDGAQGLSEMNSVFALLAMEGIDLGYPPQDSLSDEFPMDATVEAQIKPLLALHLHAFYPSAQLPEIVPINAARVMTVLRRDAVIANREESSLLHVPLGEVGGGTYDISTDDFV